MSQRLLKSKPSPKSRKPGSGDAEEDNSGTAMMGGREKTPSKFAAAAAAEDENVAGEEVEEIEMPIQPHFQKLLKDLVKRLELSIYVVVGL
jgi:hypothetical protein